MNVEVRVTTSATFVAKDPILRRAHTFTHGECADPMELLIIDPEMAGLERIVSRSAISVSMRRLRAPAGLR